MRAAFFLCCLGIAAGRMPTLDELPADKTKLMFPGAPTACADGTAFSFLVRKGTDPNRVLVDYMGGGACWNARCLDQESTQFQTGNGFWSLLDGISTFPSGLMQPPPGFSSTVADLKTWTYIFVPYCTQDIHLGTCTKTYVNDKGECRKVRHNGAANIKSVRDWIYQNFPAPKSLAFIGCSAGAAAVPYMEAARASTMYAGKNVSVAAVGDSPTNLLTEPFVREGLLQWGIEDSIKDVTGWSDVGPYLKADMIEKALSSIFTKHPKVQFGIYTRTEDSTQLKFYRLQGGMVASTLSDEDATKVWRRQNLNMLERLQSSHANFRAFIATGTQHCGMTFDQPLEIDASLRDPFKNWIESLLVTANASTAGWNCGVPCTLDGVEGCDKAVGSRKLEDKCGKCEGDGAACSLPAPSSPRRCPVPIQCPSPTPVQTGRGGSWRGGLAAWGVVVVSVGVGVVLGFS